MRVLPPQVGDVVRIRIEWGRLSTSTRHQCPLCRRFITASATSCVCGAEFRLVARGFAEVVGRGHDTP
jgi:hypothetical protein